MNTLRVIGCVVILIILALLVGLLVAPVFGAEQRNEVYIPLVTTMNTQASTRQPGSYSINDFMGVVVKKPGCLYAIVALPGVEPDSFAEYHPECHDGVATILLSFYKATGINGIDVLVVTEYGEYKVSYGWVGSYGK